MADDHGLFHDEVGAPHVLEVVDITAADAYGANLFLHRRDDRMADRVTVAVTGRVTQRGVQSDIQSGRMTDKVTEWQSYKMT